MPLFCCRCVIYGQSYAAPLLLANAGKSAMKVLVAARPELSDWISFTPDFGFIQVGPRLIGYRVAGTDIACALVLPVVLNPVM